jgi:hypothetical protein
MSRIVETIWRSVLWWDFDEEKCVYMNIHYYVTKPQLFKIKLLNRTIVIKRILTQLIDCCLL